MFPSTSDFLVTELSSVKTSETCCKCTEKKQPKEHQAKFIFSHEQQILASIESSAYLCRSASVKCKYNNGASVRNYLEFYTSMDVRNSTKHQQTQHGLIPGDAQYKTVAFLHFPHTVLHTFLSFSFCLVSIVNNYKIT